MKKILIFLVFSLVACNPNPVAKPDHLLEENEMVDILYDLAILQATENFNPIKLKESGVDTKTFIFEKYKIDSTTYYQNQRYYAADVKVYKKINQKVLDRITSQLDENTSDLDKNKEDSRLKKDTLKKSEALRKRLNERALLNSDSIRQNLPLK